MVETWLDLATRITLIVVLAVLFPTIVYALTDAVMDTTFGRWLTRTGQQDGDDPPPG